MSVVSIETEYVFKLGISKGNVIYTLDKLFNFLPIDLGNYDNLGEPEVMKRIVCAGGIVI